MTQYRIDAVSDMEEAEMIVESNRLRGYSSIIEEFSAMRWDGSDVGGDVNVIEDVDDAAFLIIGRKG
jgi:hypothetical protein